MRTILSSRRAWLSLAIGLIIGCTGGCTGTDTPPPPPDIQCTDPAPAPERTVADALAGLDALDFDEFVERSHGELLLRTPEAITRLDIADQMGVGHDRLDNISNDHIEGTYQLTAGILERLQAFDRETLTTEQQITHDVYEWYLQDREARRSLRQFEYPVTHFLGSVQRNLVLFLRDVHPMRTRADAEDYIERLRQVGDKMDQLVELLAVYQSQGVVAPRQLLEWSLPQIDSIADVSRADSLDYYTGYSARLADVAELTGDERDALREQAVTAIQCHVIPGYERLQGAVRDLIPSAPTGQGVGQYPGGDEYYQYALGYHTTTSLTPDEVHQLGLAESARIQAEMRGHFEALGYPPTESLSELFLRVQNDSELIPEVSVVAEYESIIEVAEARLPEAFHRGPPIDVIVIGGPTGGYYVAGTPDGTRPGAFYAYIGGPEPRYGMPTLTYHETVPGHHLQISLAQALQLPTIHQATHFTAYIEGWALYAEQLAAELGWYQDDVYGDLGRLQAEAFRAARLVVDTGIHAQGWTFDEAVDFMVENIGYSRPGMEGQVARYMAWPGQATAYKVGQLRILELREQAQTALGGAFNLHDFHAAVLDTGSLPLEVLERVIDDYIANSAPLP